MNGQVRAPTDQTGDELHAIGRRAACKMAGSHDWLHVKRSSSGIEPWRLGSSTALTRPATGNMELDASHRGSFTEVTLHPHVTVRAMDTGGLVRPAARRRAPAATWPNSVISRCDTPCLRPWTQDISNDDHGRTRCDESPLARQQARTRRNDIVIRRTGGVSVE